MNLLNGKLQKIIMNSCRTCHWGLIRIERTKEYAYECCSLGFANWDRYLNGLCEGFRLADKKVIEERLDDDRLGIVWGEDLEL